jgi:hypothetical protein
MSSFEKWLIAGVAVLALVALLAFLAVGLGLFGRSPEPVPFRGAGVEEPKPGPKAEIRVEELPEGPVPSRGPRTARITEEKPVAGEGGWIVGTVLDRDSRPLGGVLVTLTQGEPWSRTSSDEEETGEEVDLILGRQSTPADGTFRFEVAPGSGYKVTASYQGFAEASMAGLSVEQGETTETRPLILLIGGRVRGVVTSENGLPIPDAKVLVVLQRHLGAGIWKTPGPSARTDGSGYYEVTNVPPGKKVVFAGAEGYATASVYDVEVQDGVVTESIDFALKEGVKISGVVLEADTEVPIEGATVFATPVYPTDPSRGSTTSDAAGFFEMTSFAPHRTYRVKATKPGYIPGNITIVLGGTSDMVLYLERNGGIRGQVVDAVTGQPVPSFSIRYGESRGAEGIVGFGQRRNFDSPDGTFEIFDLNPKQYVFEVWADGYAFTRSDPIEVRRGEWVAGLRFALGQGGTVEGKVVEALSGSPVSGASVLIRPGDRMDPFFHNRYNPYLVRESAPTGADGRFSVANVGPGNYWIQIDHEEYAQKIVEGIQISEGGRIDVGSVPIFRGGIIEGTVRAGNGEPIFRAQMLLTGEGYRNRVRTDRDGFYRFEKVPAGSYTLSVERILGRQRDLVAGFPERIVGVDEGSKSQIDF